MEYDSSMEFEDCVDPFNLVDAFALPKPINLYERSLEYSLVSLRINTPFEVNAVKHSDILATFLLSMVTWWLKCAC